MASRVFSTKVKAWHGVVAVRRDPELIDGIGVIRKYMPRPKGDNRRPSASDAVRYAVRVIARRLRIANGEIGVPHDA
jgi:hypothetical protein